MQSDQPQDSASSSGPEAASSAHSTAEIEQWFVTYLAQEMQVSEDEIDVEAPFDQLAIDSAIVISMTGDLEDWLGRTIDPTLVYDYPTIASFSQYLGSKA